jgi:hypothetical protein
MRKVPPLIRRAPGNEPAPEVDTWIDRELAECQFKDVRLFQRFRKLLGQTASAVGQTIPFVCQDWANTKAAYRFFSKERVDEEVILSGHFRATRDRVARLEGRFLFSTTRRNLPISEISLGVTHRVPTGKVRNKEIPNNLVTVCGILMHSSLVATADGLPLGLASIEF